jgi:hypothetical protein
MHGSSEPDVEVDPHLARTRETGGSPDGHPADRAEGDAPGTTGTGEAEEFVGRAAGRDLGYAGETGAEARAEAASDSSASDSSASAPSASAPSASAPSASAPSGEVSP